MVKWEKKQAILQGEQIGMNKEFGLKFQESYQLLYTPEKGPRVQPPKRRGHNKQGGILV